jgi:lipopolysaccharide transport system permease protein
MNGSRITHIRPRGGWLELGLGGIWRYRDLLLIFAMRDIKVRYKQTLLGPAWMVLQPLALTAALTAAISGFAGLPTDGRPAPAFYLAALVLWSYFSQVVQATSQIFIVNGDLFSKVYFPRLIAPVATLLSSAVALAIQLAVAFGFLVWYQLAGGLEGLSWRLLALPLVTLHLAVYSLGVGLCLAASTAKYRDLAHMTPFLIQLWMFVTPVIYSYSAIPERWRVLAGLLNPLAVIVDAGRWCFFGDFAAGGAALAASVGATVATLLAGIVVFQRVERVAMDTI